jgi:hypothetical protein
MKRTILIIFILLKISVTYAGSSHFPDISPTRTWVDYAGKITINSHDPVNGTDEIAVFVNDNNGGELIAGKTVIGNSVDNYYLISVYGNDNRTPTKEGANAGDTLIFKVWSSQYNVEQTISQNQFSIESGAGLTEPVLPIVYQADRPEQYGYLHISFQTDPQDVFSKYSIPTNTESGIVCFMSILIFISIMAMRNRNYG